MSVRITSKGQVRRKLNLKTGDKLEFVLHENSVEIIPIGGSVRDLKGMVAKPEKAISLEEMDRVIRERFASE